MSTKQNNTDPTYLRTIHDGLLSGNIHKDNASTLPIGLIGIYEEALPHESNLNDRKKFLEFFAVWALLKKEVSASFLVPLLEGWTEEHVLDYISKYSKWFNSPVSGKYVLYHERLRTFVILKVSHGHFTACNEAIIQNCQTALQAKSGDEQEYYALEHLSLHLLIQAMESKDAAALKTLAYDTAHWNRQVEISKGFEWSKRMLNDMMLWASKYNDDEVIECALNKVDLHHQEQNDAQLILNLINNGDIELALTNLSNYGRNVNSGYQRRCMLYLIILTELAIVKGLKSKYDIDNINIIINDFKKHYFDQSVEIEAFFSSYLIFRIGVALHLAQIDYTFLCNCIKMYDYFWIKLVEISENDKIILDNFLNAGETNNYSRISFPKNIANLKISNRNIYYMTDEGNPFNNIYHNHFEADRHSLVGNVKFALDCFICSLEFKRHFDLYNKQYSTIDEIIKKSKSIKRSSWQIYYNLTYSLKNDEKLHRESALQDLLLKSFSSGYISETIIILNDLKNINEGHWLKSSLIQMCHRSLIRQTSRIKIDFLEFISGVFLFDDSDAIVYLINHEPIFRQISKHFKFSLTLKVLCKIEYYSDVHIKTVVLINKYTNAINCERKIFLINKIISQIIYIRLNKLKYLISFLYSIESIEKYENKILLIIIKRLNNEKIKDRADTLFSLFELLDKNVKMKLSNTFQTIFDNTISKLNDFQLFEIRCIHYSVINYSFYNLKSELFSLNGELLLSKIGPHVWMNCICSLIEYSIKINSPDWIILVKYVEEQRELKNEFDNLSFIWFYKRIADCLCDNDNSIKTLILAQIIQEKLIALEPFLRERIKINRLGDDLLNDIITYNSNIDIHDNIIHYVWKDELVSYSIIRKEYNDLISTLYLDLGFKESKEKGFLKTSISNRNSFDYFSREFKKGAVKSLDISNIDAETIIHICKNYEYDSEDTERILAIYALKELFFEDINEFKIQRFNRTLNLQWAIDIKNSLSVN